MGQSERFVVLLWRQSAGRRRRARQHPHPAQGDRPGERARSGQGDAGRASHLAGPPALGRRRSRRGAVPRRGARLGPPDQGAPPQEGVRRDLPGRAPPGPPGHELHARDPAPAGADHRSGHRAGRALAAAGGHRGRGAPTGRGVRNNRMEQLSRTARFWQWWAAFSLRRPLLVTLLGILAFVASVPFAARLYGDLRTDLRELLPQGAPAAVALAELEKRIGGLSHLAIVVRTDDLKAGERFVDALAASLKELPPSLVAQVHWRVDAEKEFLDRHGALYADVKDLIAARDAIRSQIAKANPLLVDLEENDLEENDNRPAVNLDEVVGRIKAAYARLDRYPDGYLAGEGGHTLVMLLSPPGA